jgi:hypothetical protein
MSYLIDNHFVIVYATLDNDVTVTFAERGDSYFSKELI